MIAIGQFFFRFRNALFPLIVLAAVLLARPHYSFGSEAMDLLVDLLGIAIIFAGQTLRVITIGYEYIRRGGARWASLRERSGTGRDLRPLSDPLYVGNILIATGFLVVLGRGWLILLGVPLILFIYSAIVSAEEEYLSRKFGGLYADYRERVNCWLPDWTGLRESLAPMRFNWQRVLVKEYNTIFAVLAALLLIQTWTRVGEEGMSERQWVWVIVSACGLLAGYLSIRLVKKQRWIRG